MKLYKSNAIAIDFDGTLFPAKGFPEIFPPDEKNLRVIETALRVQKAGDVLILWTCRHGLPLLEAVKACERYDLCFDYVNENIRDEYYTYLYDKVGKPHSRKIYANLYVDDKSPGSIDYFLNQYEIDMKER